MEAPPSATAPASAPAPALAPADQPAAVVAAPTPAVVDRVVVSDAMDRLIESCQNDLWPPPAAARLLGLHSRERNVEEARFA